MTADQRTVRPLTSEDRWCIDAARDVRPLLADLAGPDADAISRALDALLERADAGENVADAILAILQQHPATRRWLDERRSGSLARPAETATAEATNAEATTADAAEPPLPEASGSRRGLDFDRFRDDAAERPPPTRRSSRRTGDAAATTYPLVDCPDVLVANEEFELVVGLTDKPARGVASDGPLAVPGRDYTLSIDVHAEGFALRHGESWRQSVSVTADHRRPRLRLHLTAKTPSEPYKPRTIKASYSVDGQIVGMASRFVVVTRKSSDVADAPTPPEPRGTDVAVPTATTAPDLTARILIGEDNPDVAFWVLVSPWDGDVAIPAERYDTRIGDAKTFLTSLVADVSNAGAQSAVYEELLGVGRRIANLIPAEFWSALHAVHKQVGEAPTVLFLSEEPYVPWELALLDAPLDPDPTLPPFLGAQANVARWILGDNTPAQPPPRERRVSSMAVVVGDYADSAFEPLPEATKEAAGLTGEYQAIAIDAQLRTVLDLLRGDPKVDLVHFAVHGQYEGDAGTDGLIMVDGSVLNGNKVLARPLDGPFVFLNACQVGAGNEVLGGAAGLAADFVNAGASGVVAPLWSVNDKIAREIAAEFYARVLGDSGVSPAIALRECRAKFRDSPDASATYLAYQFFGGPNMRLIRQGMDAHG